MSVVSPDQVADFAESLSLNGETEVLMQRIIDAVEAGLTAFYDIPATPTSDITQAIIMQSLKYWNRRKNIDGVISFGETAIRVNQFDPDVKNLLAPYRTFRIG